MTKKILWLFFFAVTTGMLSTSNTAGKTVVYDFETGTQGWGDLKRGVDVTVVVETHAGGGSQSLRATIDETAHEQAQGGMASGRDFTAADADISQGGYTDLSFWYRADDPDMNGGNFVFHWIMSTQGWSGGGWYGNGLWGVLIADGQWHHQLFKLSSLGEAAGGWQGTWGDQTEWRFGDDLLYNFELMFEPADSTTQGSYVYIDDVQLTGAEEPPPPDKLVVYDFETDTQGWGDLKRGVDVTVVGETHAGGGSQSLRATIDENAHEQAQGGMTSGRDFIAADADISQGGYTDLSFWYRADDPDMNGGNFVFHWIMSTEFWSGGGWYGNGLWGVLIADGQWHKQLYKLSNLGEVAGGWEGTWGDQTEWRFGDDLLYNFELMFEPADSTTTGSYVYIDDVQLTGAEEPPPPDKLVVYDFETDTQGWGDLKRGVDVTVVGETHAGGGSQSLRATIDENAHEQAQGGMTSGRDFIAADADISQGGYTDLSFWYRADDPDMNGGNFVFHWIMSTEFWSGGGWYGNGLWGVLIADGQWHKQLYKLSNLGEVAGGWEGTWGDQTEWRFGDDLLYNFELMFEPADSTTHGSYVYIDDVRLWGGSLIPNPVPANGALDVANDTILSWDSPDSALSFNVYLGTSLDSVNNADLDSDPNVVFAAVDVSSFDPGALEFGADYFWRVDLVTVTHPGGPLKGPVWSFTTANYKIVDDFEDYDSAENRIWYSWHDGLGYGTPDTEPYFAGNGTGSVVGDESTPSFCEETIVRGGGKSMPIGFNNTGAALQSETQHVWIDPQDWTVNGFNALKIYTHGGVQNIPGELYVIIEDDKKISHRVVNPDSGIFTVEEWKEWTILLDDFAFVGVDNTAVTKLAIGVADLAGQPEASGLFYIDDILVGFSP